MNWDGEVWRLPDAVLDPNSDPEFGYNVKSSEMGHLFYEELKLLSYPDRGNIRVTDAELNASEFDNLIASWYWSGTEYAGDQGGAWGSGMSGGFQHFYDKSYDGYGLAVRSGQVSTVPVPGTIVLLASGLIGLVTVRTRRNGNRC